MWTQVETEIETEIEIVIKYNKINDMKIRYLNDIDAFFVKCFVLTNNVCIITYTNEMIKKIIHLMSKFNFLSFVFSDL